MLLGVAIGDALGNTSESMHPAERARHLGEVRDYLPNEHANGRRVGVPSDDTQLTFRTLEQLLDDRQLSAVGLLERFSAERIFGIGAATREVMALFRGGRFTSTGVKSAGNGGLMRIAPVLLPHLHTRSADLGIVERSDELGNAPIE